MALPVDLGPNYWGTNYNYNDGMLNTPNNPDIINYQSFRPNTLLDNRIKNMLEMQKMGYDQPNLQPLKERDWNQHLDEGTPLSLPRDEYKGIEGWTASANNTMTDANYVDNNEGFGITQIDTPYNYYDVDRYTADEDMTYQPDVQSNRFSGITNPVKTGAGMLVSGLTKIPGIVFHTL